MSFLDGLPVWGLAIVIFLLRIVDVSMGTLRTIAVVQGRVVFSVFLGFLEVLVWVTVVTKVFQSAASDPMLLVAYALGFAAGNAVGILAERRLAMGTVILRIVTTSKDELAVFFRDHTPRVITFEGHADADPITLLYVIVRRKSVRPLLRQAQEIDPELMFVVDPVYESNAVLIQPLPNPTGWRSVMKMK